MVTFSNPTVKTGGWLVTYAQDGNVRQFAVGARPGWLSKKPTADYFRGFGNLGLLIHGAHYLIDDRELELGPLAYAKSLGFEVPTLEAGSGSGQEPGTRTDERAVEADVEGRFRRIDRLRNAGLITDDEYAAATPRGSLEVRQAPVGEQTATTDGVWPSHGGSCDACAAELQRRTTGKCLVSIGE